MVKISPDSNEKKYKFMELTEAIIANLVTLALAILGGSVGGWE